MKWQRVSSHGMQSGEYRVAKDFIDGCSLYVLYHNHELIKVCNDFDECKQLAKEHSKGMK